MKQEKNHARGGGRKLPSGESVSVQHILDLKAELEVILARWRQDNTIGGALFSAHYIRIIAKSNRIKAIFREPEDTICGARFEETNGSRRHVFTYFMSLDDLDDAVCCLEECCIILQSLNKCDITADDMDNIMTWYGPGVTWLAWPRFNGIVVDSYFVSQFSIDEIKEDRSERSLVSFYKTNADMDALFRQVKLFTFVIDHIDEYTYVLDPGQYKSLKDKYPYLIAMSVTDLTNLCPEKTLLQTPEASMSIPSPHDEPVIGVMDTLFSDDVYFNEWVDARNMLDPTIPVGREDYVHGTEIDSIIVDGPALNPRMDDHCGRFRVKHFSVATHNYSSFSILKAIRLAVCTNRDIKVWNLSLGSELEIEKNFISPVGAELDRLQMEFNVIFIVSGTNKPADRESMRIGSPADSINSLVVNSVNRHNQPASYTREGPVLSFYQKPDVSYYGGDSGTGINVWAPDGLRSVAGTSFAAPWITRKVAYLIYYLGLPLEVAKALIIDSAIGWNPRDSVSTAIGYGVVPVKIEDVIHCRNDEIRFYVNILAHEDKICAYNIPVPGTDTGYPYIARATMCWFSDCDRYNGVDYTGTDTELRFGRVRYRNTRAGKVPEIIPVDMDSKDTEETAASEGSISSWMKQANVSFICESQKGSYRTKKRYGNYTWGLELKVNRRNPENTPAVRTYGLVVTFKEITGRNRINDFINLCLASDWAIRPIDVRESLEVYAKGQEELTLE